MIRSDLFTGLLGTSVVHGAGLTEFLVGPAEERAFGATRSHCCGGLAAKHS